MQATSIHYQHSSIIHSRVKYSTRVPRKRMLWTFHELFPWITEQRTVIPYNCCVWFHFVHVCIYSSQSFNHYWTMLLNNYCGNGGIFCMCVPTSCYAILIVAKQFSCLSNVPICSYVIIFYLYTMPCVPLWGTTYLCLIFQIVLYNINTCDIANYM